MPDFSNPIPAYLTSRRNIVQLVLFTALFALLFINIYEPFGVNVWFTITRWQLLLYSSLITLTGVLVVVLSRIIMYYSSRKRQLKYWGYFLWVLAEVLFMALFYAVYIKFFLKDERFFPDLIKLCVQNTALLLLLPYSVLWLYFSWKEKKIVIEELAQAQPVLDSTKVMIPFLDDKGTLRFSVKSDNLLYIESSDNYVSIYYLNKESVTRFMLRNTLKNIEDALKGTDVVRCHRKYMVNCERVRVIRREKEIIELELDIPGTLNIPVSKTFAGTVMSTFSHYLKPGDD
ncbi:MAG: LytTR family transcriptional regulator [Bacteroidales bacterium]|nr:LytTR family transcriptional regulator [Bacteroidales bacterium]